MWYHSGVRGYAMCLGVVLVVSGCGAGPQPEPTGATTPAATSAAPNPAAIERVRSDLPPGYEVAELPGNAAPAAFWGVKPDWTADPPQCAVLADPGAGAPTHGWSASGPGGIIHAVVAGPGARPPIPPGCAAWTLTGGRTTAAVSAVGGPDIADTPTVAMAAVATTVVEGGTETRSHADTATAFLHSGYVVFVTVVTDPGSALPTLGPDVAARLLVSAVAGISGRPG